MCDTPEYANENYNRVSRANVGQNFELKMICKVLVVFSLAYSGNILSAEGLDVEPEVSV